MVLREIFTPMAQKKFAKRSWRPSLTVVSHAAGPEGNHAAADYIAFHNGDKKTLLDCLRTIQEVSAKILNELFPEQSRNHSQDDSEGLPSSAVPDGLRDSPIIDSQSAVPEESLSPER
jgi:hypothetical protein